MACHKWEIREFCGSTRKQQRISKKIVPRGIGHPGTNGKFVNFVKALESNKEFLKK